MSDVKDLALVPITDLIDEITRRNDGIAIVAYQFLTKGGDYQIRRRWKGNHLYLVGCLVDLQRKILADIEEDEDSPDIRDFGEGT